MFETTTELSGYLAPNERVLWQGQGRRRTTSASTAGYFFMLMFVGVALIFVLLFLTTSRSSRNSDDAIALVILPIVFVAVGLGVGIPLVLMGQRTGNARYYVTTSSAVIRYPAVGWAGPRTTILPLKNLQQLTLSENRDGTGTLTFGQSFMAGYSRYSSSWLMEATPAFWNIERPQEVYQLIRKQMAEV